jgi:hypothetical protein
MNYYRLVPIIISLVLFAMVFALPAAAQLAPLGDTPCETLGIACDKDASATSVGTRVVGIINIFLALAGLIALIMIIVGGVQYIISLGDDNKLQQAKNIILYALIGLIIIGLAAVVVNFVINIFAGGGGPGGGGGGPGGGGGGPGGGGGGPGGGGGGPGDEVAF